MSDFKCPMCLDCPDNCPLDTEEDTREHSADYYKGREDALNIYIDTPMHFTYEQKAWVKKYIIRNGQANYERGAREFAEKIKSDIEKWWYRSELDMGAENVNSLIDGVLAEWQKGKDNEIK